ncbi:hypothetical protein ACUN29_17890 [Streptomyces sp. WC2508]|uniref:hypothetical protein n=1 Tax=Streptomyces sp. WC2508 TaxID=3461405 RepID=UPI0040442A9D
MSKGNYVGLTSSPDDVYGSLMSIPDHLTEPYLQLLTEWTDDEIRVVTKRLKEGTAHPMAVKRILAGEVVAALHGRDTAAAARAEFTARFSKQSFGDTQNLPVVSLKEHAEDTLGALLSRTLGFALSLSAVRRVAQQKGLRLIRESDGEMHRLRKVSAPKLPIDGHRPESAQQSSSAPRQFLYTPAACQAPMDAMSEHEMILDVPADLAGVASLGCSSDIYLTGQAVAKPGAPIPDNTPTAISSAAVSDSRVVAQPKGHAYGIQP